MERLLEMDGAFLLWVQNAVRSEVLTPLVQFYTHLGDTGLLWIVLSLGMLLFKKTRKAGIAGLIALFLGALCTNVTLKHLIARPRPWLSVEGLVPLVAEHDPNSFPSGHTCAAFAAAVAWLKTLPWRGAGVTAVVFAALMGASRLYVGVHFPSDVLVGMLVGLLCALLGCWICRKGEKLLERRKVQP